MPVQGHLTRPRAGRNAGHGFGGCLEQASCYGPSMNHHNVWMTSFLIVGAITILAREASWSAVNLCVPPSMTTPASIVPYTLTYGSNALFA